MEIFYIELFSEVEVLLDDHYQFHLHIIFYLDMLNTYTDEFTEILTKLLDLNCLLPLPPQCFVREKGIRGPLKKKVLVRMIYVSFYQ